MIINGNAMSMTKGDTESLTVQINNKSGTKINLVDGDTVYFTVKNTTKDIEKILQKIITVFRNGKAEIFITHDDTKDLVCKAYVYDIQVNRVQDGSVTTIVPPSKFVLTEEVTYE